MKHANDVIASDRRNLRRHPEAAKWPKDLSSFAEFTLEARRFFASLRMTAPFAVLWTRAEGLRMTCVLATTFLIVSFSPPLFAFFSDQVAAPREEIWQAARQVLEPYGIRKAKEDTKKVETDWIEERIIRSSGLLKKIAKRTYRLRYRIKVEVKDDPVAPPVEVQADYQQKPLDASPSDVWKRARPDRDIEKEFFQKILFQIEKNRKKPR